MSTKEMSPVKVGLIGLGTVGSGVVDILIHNANEISRRSGREIQASLASVKHIDKKRSIPSDDIKLVTDPFAVTNHADIDIICELTGVVELAREIVLNAIENGKHVVTANKALIALHGNEIFAAAHSRRVMVAFEAAVAGGIPIIKVIREALAANQIEWIAGIINGTSNFILTRMRDDGGEYSEILKEAKSLGYAEPDSAFDVEGIDAAHKFTILASIAFGIPLQFEKIYIEGINKIEQRDIAYASELGYRIKHLGITRKTAAYIPVIILTQRVQEKTMNEAIAQIQTLESVTGDVIRIRLETLDG